MIKLEPFEKADIINLIAKRLYTISERPFGEIDYDEWKHYSDIALKVMELT